MPRRILTGELIERFKLRSDMKNDDSIERDEWLSFASEVFGEMWAEVSVTVGNRSSETSLTIPADGSASYDEPVDHFTTIRVVELLPGGKERELRELMPGEEVSYRGCTGEAVGWTHVDDQIFLYPAPASGTYVWHYTSQPTDLTENSDSEPINVISPAGEAFLIWGVTIIAKGIGGKDPQLALTMQARAREQLQVWAANRTLTEARTRGEDPDDDVPIDPAERWPYR